MLTLTLHAHAARARPCQCHSCPLRPPEPPPAAPSLGGSTPQTPRALTGRHRAPRLHGLCHARARIWMRPPSRLACRLLLVAARSFVRRSLAHSVVVVHFGIGRCRCSRSANSRQLARMTRAPPHARRSMLTLDAPCLRLRSMPMALVHAHVARACECRCRSPDRVRITRAAHPPVASSSSSPSPLVGAAAGIATPMSHVHAAGHLHVNATRAC